MSDLSFAEVEAWLKARRDKTLSHGYRTQAWYEFDAALDDLREHAQTGSPLSEVVRGPHHEEQG